MRSAWRSIDRGSWIRCHYSPFVHSQFSGTVVRCCANAVVGQEASFAERLSAMTRYRTAAPPSPQIARLNAPAKVHLEPDLTSETVADLPSRELVQTFADLDGPTEWVLVRAPLEDKIDMTSEKPLEYQDGWLHNPQIELTDHQLGHKVAARVDVESHPTLNALRWLHSMLRTTPLPTQVLESVSEFHTGKIGGVVKHGRYLVQRPSGAVPERIATEGSKLLVPKQRWRRIMLSAGIGMGLAVVLGIGLHGWSWLNGVPMETGRRSWPNLVGWLTLVVVFITPFSVLPCYSFAISQLSTLSVVAWLNILLYFDLFSE